MDPEELAARVDDELEVRRVLALVDAATAHKGVFVGQVVAVSKVKTGDGLPGKALIEFVPENGAPEFIETDWLTDPAARAVARRANNLTGTKAVLFKLNEPDPSGKVSQGFRRLVWIKPA